MNELIDRYRRRLRAVELNFRRSMVAEIDLSARLTGIKGQRGVGKTTMMLQFMKAQFGNDDRALYASLDNLWFGNHRLYELADEFVKRGGEWLFLDEVHKYPNWSQELKNIYDDFPELKIWFTGSSLLEILNSRADLSRRAVVYQMQGLSFREFLELEQGLKLPALSLSDILQNHGELSSQILEQVKPLAHFREYLSYGYYPFYKESKSLYYGKIEEVLNMILEVELPLLRQIDLVYVQKLKQVLMILAESVPFVPNITKLSERIGINRKTLLQYIYYLGEAGLLNNLYRDAAGISRLQKPDKLYLENTNIAFAISPQVNEGTLRETFFLNQVGYQHRLEYSANVDFVVDGRYQIEIGGKDKDTRQIAVREDAFIVADNIEYGTGNRIPLWLFGFLY